MAGMPYARQPFVGSTRSVGRRPGMTTLGGGPAGDAHRRCGRPPWWWC